MKVVLVSHEVAALWSNREEKGYGGGVMQGMLTLGHDIPTSQGEGLSAIPRDLLSDRLRGQKTQGTLTIHRVACLLILKHTNTFLHKYT